MGCQESSEGWGESWRKQERCESGLGQGSAAVRPGAGPQGPWCPWLSRSIPWAVPFTRGWCRRTALWGRKRGTSQASCRPASGVRRGTHNVGADGAEGCCAAGEQVAAVEWQEDFDVVLTVPLGRGRKMSGPSWPPGGTPESSPPNPRPVLG